MPINSIFNTNQLKVCQNVELKIKLDVQIEILVSEYKEILELFELFDHFNENKLNKYSACFGDKIITLKKLLKNTQKRLDYNMIRC